MKKILFVCTGNTCRSPMAEGMLRKLAKQRGLTLEVQSAGVSAMDGMPVSHHAQGILQDQDIQDNLVSKALSAALVDWADLILTLTQSHKQYAIRQFPHAADKMHTLKEYVEDDPRVLEDLQELDSLYASLELARSLGRDVSESERERLMELSQRMPSFDISDPFGGSRENYEATAAEIRTALFRLLDKLEGELSE